MNRSLPLAAAALSAVALSGCGGSSSAQGTAGSGSVPLVGLFEVAAGGCAAGQPTGSWFRMVTPGGTPAKGPYVANPDSPCKDKQVTTLSAGKDGGLRTGGYQSQPNPAFTAGGSSTATSVLAPVGFFAVGFGVSTNRTDPQTGASTPVPSARRTGSTLTADLSAWSVSWNGQHFNQGAPKPGAGGSSATGTFDATTGAYTLDWSSRIKGGPFNGFTGIWHLSGRFRTT